MSRFLRGVLVGCAATLAVGAALAGWAYHRASTSDCGELPREDLSLREMGQLRRRLDAYKQSTRPSPLILTGREASFLVREEFGFPAWLEIDGGELHVLAQIGEGGRCWDLGFRGQIEVEHAVARIRPTQLSVGRLDLTWIVSGRTFDVPVSDPVPGAPEDRGLREIAGHLLTLQLADDSAYLRIDDPKWIR